MVKIYILQTDMLQKRDFLQLVDELGFGEAESQRIIAMGNSGHRWESLGGLCALRRLVDKCGIKAPLSIARSATGKPYFEGNDPLPFGISHSRTVAAAALGEADMGELGFDMEIVDGNYDFSAISERFFTEDEKRRFKDRGQTADVFFAIWTAKEAIAKLDGRGLSSVLSCKCDTGAADIVISTLTVSVGEKKAVISLATHGEHQPIEIYTDSEE